MPVGPRSDETFAETIEDPRALEAFDASSDLIRWRGQVGRASIAACPPIEIIPQDG
jgi:hypothetical protein